MDRGQNMYGIICKIKMCCIIKFTGTYGQLMDDAKPGDDNCGESLSHNMGVVAQQICKELGRAHCHVHHTTPVGITCDWTWKSEIQKCAMGFHATQTCLKNPNYLTCFCQRKGTTCPVELCTISTTQPHQSSTSSRKVRGTATSDFPWTSLSGSTGLLMCT